MRKQTHDRAPSPKESEPSTGDEVIRDLTSLLAPSSTTAFLESFLRKQRLFVKTAQPRRAESLLPRWSIDRLIASSFLPQERLQVLRNGEVVPPDQFRNSDGQIRSKALDALIEEGVSFIVNGVDDDFPLIAHLSDAIERELGHCVWVNAYITHGSGGALPAHYDDHDVMVLQAHGSKRWFGYGAPHPLPIERSPDGVDFEQRGPSWEALLEPGDLLYLPRGEVHRASVVGAFSVHLTIGIEPLRGVDLLASLAKEAQNDAVFREDLTRLGGKENVKIQERRLKDRMHVLIERADLETFLQADDAERSLRRVPHPSGANHPFGLHDVVLPRVKRKLSLTNEPIALGTMRIGGETIRLSALAVKVLSLLIESNGSTREKLFENLTGDHTEESVRNALAELARHSLTGH